MSWGQLLAEGRIALQEQRGRQQNLECRMNWAKMVRAVRSLLGDQIPIELPDEPPSGFTANTSLYEVVIRTPFEPPTEICLRMMLGVGAGETAWQQGTYTDAGAEYAFIVPRWGLDPNSPVPVLIRLPRSEWHYCVTLPIAAALAEQAAAEVLTTCHAYKIPLPGESPALTGEAHASGQC